MFLYFCGKHFLQAFARIKTIERAGGLFALDYQSKECIVALTVLDTKIYNPEKLSPVTINLDNAMTITPSRLCCYNFACVFSLPLSLTLQIDNDDDRDNDDEMVSNNWVLCV